MVGTAAQQHMVDSSSFHMVRGRKRGLRYDPGASSGTIGTDTVREYKAECLGGINLETMPSNAEFAGIDGEATSGFGKVMMPLGIPALNNLNSRQI